MLHHHTPVCFDINLVPGPMPPPLKIHDRSIHLSIGRPFSWSSLTSQQCKEPQRNASKREQKQKKGLGIIAYPLCFLLEAATGFEPVNNGFAEIELLPRTAEIFEAFLISITLGVGKLMGVGPGF